MALIDPDGRQTFICFGGWSGLGGNSSNSISSGNGSHLLAENIRDILNNSVGNANHVFEYQATSTILLQAAKESLGKIGINTEIEIPEVTSAYNEIKNILNENPNEIIILYGYSQGGANIVELAKKLDKAGINVDALFTVDAYDDLTESSGFLIPSNVRINYNYFQLYPSTALDLRGSSNTGNNVKNKIIKEYKHDGFKEVINHMNIDEATIDPIKILCRGLFR